MKISSRCKIIDKKIKIDVTDVFSFKNDLKFELLINTNENCFAFKNYLVEEICVDDEYSYYLVFDVSKVCFEKVKSINLIQFKNIMYSSKKIIYYFLSLIKEETR